MGMVTTYIMRAFIMMSIVMGILFYDCHTMMKMSLFYIGESRGFFVQSH